MRNYLAEENTDGFLETQMNVLIYQSLDLINDQFLRIKTEKEQ